MKNVGNGWMPAVSGIYLPFLLWAIYRQAPQLELGISLGAYVLCFAGSPLFMFYQATHGVWDDAGKVILVAISYALNFALCMYFLTRMSR